MAATGSRRRTRRCFKDSDACSSSHRGYDAGALGMARSLARALDATLVTATVSRLLVELNRSPGRQFRYSPIMRVAPRALRAEICKRYYIPYWAGVEDVRQESARDGQARGARFVAFVHPA